MTKSIKWTPWENIYSNNDASDEVSGWQTGQGGGEAAVAAAMPHMGIMNMRQFGRVMSQFNLWIMETDFPLTDKIKKSIKALPYVETLDPVSKLRLRIGIGRLFDTKKAQRDIGYFLGVVDGDHRAENPRGVTINAEYTEKVSDFVRRNNDRHGRWGIYLLPNGEIKQSAGDDFDGDIATFRVAQNLVGGIIYTNADDY